MKKFAYVLPVFLLIACGGSEDTNETEDVVEENPMFATDDELIVAAQDLKTKLGEFQASFVEIGNKEVEETICTESSTIPYSGNANEMNVWLMSTYMLDNFSVDEFGKNNFRMPNALIREVTPLSELNWLNMNGLDTALFDLYRTYPDLKDVPKTAKDSLQKVSSALSALEDGILCVIVITDYLPPKFTSETEYETGYVMGYLTFGDWESGQLSCISPFLAQNSSDKDFMNETQDLSHLLKDLQDQTYAVIDSVAVQRTGFSGDVYVNAMVKLKEY